MALTALPDRLDQRVPRALQALRVRPVLQGQAELTEEQVRRVLRAQLAWPDRQDPLALQAPPVQPAHQVPPAPRAPQVRRVPRAQRDLRESRVLTA